jgi:hypothetical protein
MPVLVPTIRTTPTIQTFSESILQVESEITKAAAGVLYAQFAGETGRGFHCYGHNLGNVKWSQGCGYDYHALNGVWEGVSPAMAQTLISSGQARPDPSLDHAKAVGTKQVSVLFNATHPASWFRSYPTLHKGMEVFVAAKKNPTSRYASAWPFLLAGDCDGYARALHAKGYFTADPGIYAKSMKGFHSEWMKSAAFEAAQAKVLSSVAVETPDDDGDVQPTVDMITGETWVLDFEIVHPKLDWTIPTRCPDCGELDCVCP